ncbi:ATP-dependent protease LonB [Geomicrobium sp. JCM 19038]|uniref:ATP-dependent protease LonB n=1 Tax=Geomicrobium sp. JCM 19038 TaxID=1460635 RepID=UPI00045F2AEB|nr:ATP-dependent protease LonB [Geomicrobium sp. JCM 19038]GAK09263.1 ATP-dependent protease La LonB type I [Geomicrobium sp. JCM 19038]
MNWTSIFMVVQVFFGVVIGLYFWNLLKNQRTQKVSVDRESRKEMMQLQKLRSISLNEPLAEKVRPQRLDDIIGQDQGILSLEAALCGPNPQHVLIYGPPGVGKTAAARLVMNKAKENSQSPFASEAPFIELDGTTARFDERGIADPLIGSVHDPIYQGAGSMGQAGIPQPKPGAVTKAHGGMLFIDEIGELHSIQLNKMLKVLEDRKVFLESAYYNEENMNIPRHIHDIFQNGLPADFRLIGATTRTPDEIPPAIRSRCLEVFFRPLKQKELSTVAKKASERLKMTINEKSLETISTYVTNGREAVNTVQIAAGLATTENREEIFVDDIEWVVHASRLTRRPERMIHNKPAVGRVNGLAVYGADLGMLLEIEATARETDPEKGMLTVTGIAEEENAGNQMRSIRRKSMARSSVDNVMTVLRRLKVPVDSYDIHVNFPGGTPIDGPSAGAAIATAIYSAVHQYKVKNDIAITGELSIWGTLKPVGGVPSKVAAALEAGAKTAYIPVDNDETVLHRLEGINVIPLTSLDELFDAVLLVTEQPNKTENVIWDENQSSSM